MNQESSPNFPTLYLEFSRSLGKPQTTLTKCGWDFDKWGSIKVENLFNRTRDKARPVRQIDCMFTVRLSLSNIDCTLLLAHALSYVENKSDLY